MKSLLAIVIIGYNEALGLERCGSSAKRAAEAFRKAYGTPPELLFVDAHSNDQSVEIANALSIAVAQAPVRFKTCTNNRMTGFLLTESKYIMFLDGDMELDEHWLTKGVDFLEANDHAAGVAGLRHDMRLLPSGHFARIENYNRIRTHVEPVQGDVGGAFLLRRAAIDDVGGLEAALAPEEDCFLFCKLLTRGWRLYRIKYPMITHWDLKLASLRQSLRHVVWNSRATVSGVILRRALTYEGWACSYLWHFKRHLIVHLLWLLSLGAWWTVWKRPHMPVGCALALASTTAVYSVHLWMEKRSFSRAGAAVLLRLAYLLQLIIGFVCNRPEIEFGCQNTTEYRREVQALNPHLAEALTHPLWPVEP